MKASRKSGATKPLSAELQLKALIAKYEPKHQRLIRSMRKALRARFPSANELVYDYATSLVIGYSPMEQGSESVVAIAAGADGLRLFFNHGPHLPDPEKILLGSGKQTRYIRIESTATLKLPEVEALVRAAIARTKIPLPKAGRGTLIIKSSAAKRKPRRRQ